MVMPRRGRSMADLLGPVRLTASCGRFMAASKVLGEQTVSAAGTTAATGTHTEGRPEQARNA